MGNVARRNRRFVGEVTFTSHGYLVRVGSDDRIVVARDDAAVDEAPS